VLIVAENGYCTAVLELLPAATMVPAMMTTAAAGPRSGLQKFQPQFHAGGLMLCEVLTAIAKPVRINQQDS
jgi:hypothetical protein